MKNLPQILLLATTVLCFCLPGVVASERWETLRAINLVENPTNQTRPGRMGELGPYQFRRDTWRQYTHQPFSLAIDRTLADEVAVRHYEHIRRDLNAAGIAPSVFNIALAWNCGINAVLAGRIPPVTYDYAQRVGNLVDSFAQTKATIHTSPTVLAAAAPAAGAGVTAMVSFAVRKPDCPVFTLNTGAPMFTVRPVGKPAKGSSSLSSRAADNSPRVASAE